MSNWRKHLLADQLVGKDVFGAAGTHNHTNYAATTHTHTEGQITDLVHDATKIRSIAVANSGPADNMLLTFDNALGQWVPEAGTGHTHLQANVTDLVHDATKIQSVTVGTGAPAADNLLTFDDVSGTWRPEAASGHQHDATYATLVHSHGAAQVPTFAGTFAAKDFISTVNVVIDGGGSVIAAGQSGFWRMDYAATIQAVATGASTPGSIEIDIRKTGSNSFPPVAGDTIVASAPPTITNSLLRIDTTITGWTTGVAAGDWLLYRVTSCSSITQATLALKVARA